MDFCNEHSGSGSSAYSWLARAQKDDRAAALLRRGPCPKFMGTRLSDAHETIIERSVPNPCNEIARVRYIDVLTSSALPYVVIDEYNL